MSENGEKCIIFSIFQITPEIEILKSPVWVVISAAGLYLVKILFSDAVRHFQYFVCAYILLFFPHALLGFINILLYSQIVAITLGNCYQNNMQYIVSGGM